MTTAKRQRSAPATNGRPHLAIAATPELLDRPLPAEPDTELALLGCAMLDGSVIDKYGLRLEQFSDAGNRLLFAAIDDERRAGGADITTIAARLQRQSIHGQNALDFFGGPARLARSLETATVAHAGYYAEKVQRAAHRRRIIGSGLEIVRQAYEGDDFAANVADELETLRGCLASRNNLPVNVSDLVARNPTLAQPIIGGLLRRGETANIIAPTKFGKSWLGYGIALDVTQGAAVFGHFGTFAGRVLIVDNELSAPTLAHRLSAVSQAKGIKLADCSQFLDVLSLRGRLMDLHGLADALNQFQPGQYDLIICDTFYRFLPAGVSENDNAQITALYNLIDATTQRLNAAWANIHHASKGLQSDKAVTDVGSGAGAQSRAADCHIILRQHEEPGVAVLEAAVRSFAPVEPLALRWEFPLWVPADGIDPAKLKGRLTRQQENQIQRDEEGTRKILSALAKERLTARSLRSTVGLSRERCDRLLAMLESEGKVRKRPMLVRGNETFEYYVGDATAHPSAHVA